MYSLLQKTQNKILKKIYTIPFLEYQSEIAYQIAAAKHTLNLPVISSTDLDLVERIRQSGVVITSLEELGISSTPQLLQAAKKLMSEIAETVAMSKNEFAIHASSQQIMKYPAVFLWGLEQRLLNIVENFLGLPAAYHGAYFRRDIANKVEKGSRLWHLDKEARKVIKIIVYLHDTSENQGPFQYLPQSLTSKIARSLKYTSGYILDKTMQEIISPANYKSCIGSAGTVIFAATSNIFHRGSIPIASDRFAVFFDYTPRLKNYSFYGSSSLPHTDLLLLAKNLSEKQKRSIF
ncbi:2OG-Fe(II) oxygenase [Cylindrospermum sp. FACHB-282]|uniref:2OG-Fe(II) oxygenase n=1 Tax=Cylindrospermum sp. FACHB-282 TaxID=2692794 RepID=UPI001683519A|nr:2OG-Fe(II) oxygenase [Cylindrospermum sp. FACHB-282]MBD2384128.1 2OG-Fe(II) oxygenase [Cylindrospermum sp. FACHB-282]